jgi:Helicase conserved C-terminal domain
LDIDYSHAERFVDWLMEQAIVEARGDERTRLKVAPAGRFWLGRIAPAEKVQHSRLGERGERLEPCEVGFRLRLDPFDGRTVACRVRLCAWRQISESDDPDTDKWEKTEYIDVALQIRTPTHIGAVEHAGRAGIAGALTRVGADGLAAEMHAEMEPGKDGPELVLTLVNTSPEVAPHLDTNLYEAAFEAQVGLTQPFLLEGLEDTFRYDRRVPAYGVNGGVEGIDPSAFRSTDVALFDRRRPVYWDKECVGEQPALTFERLATDPLQPLRELVSCFDRWVDTMWSDIVLHDRAREDGWDDRTRAYAFEEAVRARQECERVRQGLELLENDAVLRRAFQLANRAFHEAPGISHTAWRPFQLGFFLANISALHADGLDEREIVDTLWFATGGGKTETYLLYSLTAAFHDRLRGKREGITSWARFPLRMLSLDQTQRFVDVMAAAELVREVERIEGDEFSVGFLVGQAGTPNSIKKDPRPGDFDPSNADALARSRVLLRCPFCRTEDLEMRFDRQRWALDHVCRTKECRWADRPLPFRIVDEEIYRWLPTVVLGTLDKAASVALQAAMRGFYGAPSGRCARPGHGFTYAPRSKSPTGCLYPDCKDQPRALSQDTNLYAPTIRMQDELHLLRDSLGSIDAHYEALLDALQLHWGSRPKLIASSATLAGHGEQVRALYRREGRTFPLPGPRSTRSFWSKDSDRLSRRYAGLAPRGVTLEYANDQLAETLQRAVRRALSDPDAVAHEVGIPQQSLYELVSAYGVDVVYGSTLKDVEAAARSFESQIPIPRLNPVTLTGRTPLEEVRSTLRRLKNPEPDFDDRIHLVAASSMLSHGVDIDRLNVMVMLGLPLSTAEFIQTTARVGRAYPGIVFVFHKIARERDAAVFRVFPSFIQHMDRLIDPVPITSKSRRVLELTFAGLEQARIYGVHEPQAVGRGLRQLTKPAHVRRAFQQLPVPETREFQELVRMLAIEGPLDENLRSDLKEYVRQFYRELNDPASAAEWVSDLFPTGEPMMSLRDVEEQVPVYSRGGAS